MAIVSKGRFGGHQNAGILIGRVCGPSESFDGNISLPRISRLVVMVTGVG